MNISNDNHSSENLRDLSSVDNTSSVDIQSNLSNQAQLAHSGNSDVNIQIQLQIDLTPIAFTVLYALLAKKQISNEEFELALKRLEEYKSK
jgi:hypothetical protein